MIGDSDPHMVIRRRKLDFAIARPGAEIYVVEQTYGHTKASNGFNELIIDETYSYGW